MNELRVGLVEAAALAIHDLRGRQFDIASEEYAEVALDAALGFLIDNAEAWARKSSALRMAQAVSKADSVWTRYLIAALRETS